DAPAQLSVASWREQHLYAAFASLGRLTRRPGAALLTMAMMALVLLLPLALALLVDNLARLERSLEWPRGLSAFLQPGATSASANQLAASWRREPDVAEVALRNPEQGREELARLPGFAPALALLDANPLPFVLSVMPAPGADSAVL